MDSQTRAILERTSQFFEQHGRRAFLVGGSLRDLLLGEVSRDWDITVEGDAHGLARKLAKALGGVYVHMHDRASRVIIRQGEAVEDAIVLDIAPLNGASIHEDLHARDFTINAMAAPLESIAHLLDAGVGSGALPGKLSGLLIDPFHGQRDLRARHIHAVDRRVFQLDPLRMLRAVRLAARYHLIIDDATRGMIQRDAALLPTVAAERIHDELYAILEPDGATDQLHLLDDLGLLTTLFPEFIPARGMRQPYPHYWDVLEHSLETVGALERVAHVLVRGVMMKSSDQDRPRHSERSEESETPGAEILRFAQNDILPVVAGKIHHRAPTDERHTHLENTIGHIPDSGVIEEIRNILQEGQEQAIFSFDALVAPRMKMAALLHDIGKPATFSIGEDGGIHFYNHPRVGVKLAQQIMRRLNASTQDRRLAEQVAAHHMRPGQLGQDGQVTPRAIRRYFVDLGPTGMLVAIFSLADHLATFGPQPLTDAWERHLGVVKLLLASYVRERESILPTRLIAADELMHRLKLEPGPLVGKILSAIEEAQAEGTVHSKEEALWLAEEMRRGEGE